MGTNADGWAQALRASTKRNEVGSPVPVHPWPNGPVDVWAAGDVSALKPYADAMDGIAPLWHGWALRDAYIAGYRAAMESVSIQAIGDGTTKRINAVTGGGTPWTP